MTAPVEGKDPPAPGALVGKMIEDGMATTPAGQKEQRWLAFPLVIEADFNLVGADSRHTLFSCTPVAAHFRVHAQLCNAAPGLCSEPPSPLHGRQTVGNHGSPGLFTMARSASSSHNNVAIANPV
jgi:hypothetical protein